MAEGRKEKEKEKEDAKVPRISATLEAAESDEDIGDDLNFDEEQVNPEGSPEANEECGDQDDESDIVFEEILDELDQDDHEENLHDTSSDQLFFDGCPLTVSMHLVAIINICDDEHLTWNALFNLLTLIYLHCPSPNNSVQGQCGCPYCKESGNNIRTQKGGNCRTYPYVTKKERAEKAEPRDHQVFYDDGKTAVDRMSNGVKTFDVDGVKGISPAFGLPGYD
ncbi:hypothetical protein OS493_030384 [Desmophyllum pertusum]|uniref:Uncharacterized protein n=1 Tax=Desmophyllum pertusum TaxID=174260 RepID=A0A9W9ZBU7_9CNID|nr:hypothetical protein OS493_030384 [Desmophyllum pertusum]